MSVAADNVAETNSLRTDSRNVRPETRKNLGGTDGEWKFWLDMALPESKDYIFRGGLSLLAVDRENDQAVYLEPNV